MFKYHLYRFSLAMVTIALGLLIPVTTYATSSGYAASDVLGQLTGGLPDFTTSGSGVSAVQMHYPAGTQIDTVHHRLFVTDSSNNRVLIYILDSSNNLASHTANYVLGQPDFTSNQSATTQSGMNSPYAGLSYDATNDRLFVSDSGNNRVLVYDLSNGISNGMNASYVLGQSSFTTNSINLTQSGLNSPNGLAYDPQHQVLYVADCNNKRVLEYNVASGNIADGMNASHVIGQSNFTSNTTVTSQSGIQTPIAIAYNNVTQTLFLGDNNSNRILTFDLSNGVTDGMNASHVLGQSNFTNNSSSGGAPTASTIQAPEALAVDSKRNILYAQDDSNNRIVAFDLSNGITNNMTARLVLGQTDFYSSDYSCSLISATTVCDSEGGLTVDPVNDRLYVTDSGYNRLLIYNFAHFITPTGSLTPAANGQSYSFAVAIAGQQGSGLFSQVSGNLPPGLALNTTTGVISGTPTQAGTYTFELGYEDTIGTVGTTYDDPTYSITVATPVTQASITASSTPGAPNTGLYPESNSRNLVAIAAGIALMAMSIIYLYKRKV